MENDKKLEAQLKRLYQYYVVEGHKLSGFSIESKPIDRRCLHR